MLVHSFRPIESAQTYGHKIRKAQPHQIEQNMYAFYAECDAKIRFSSETAKQIDDFMLEKGNGGGKISGECYKLLVFYLFVCQASDYFVFLHQLKN